MERRAARFCNLQYLRRGSAYSNDDFKATLRSGHVEVKLGHPATDINPPLLVVDSLIHGACTGCCVCCHYTLRMLCSVGLRVRDGDMTSS